MKTITIQEVHKLLRESDIKVVESGEFAVETLMGAPNHSFLSLFYTVDKENDTRVSFLERDNQFVRTTRNGNMILVSDEGKEFEIALLKKQNLYQDAEKENFSHSENMKEPEFKAQRSEKPPIVIYSSSNGNILFSSTTASDFNVALEEALSLGTNLYGVSLFGRILNSVDFSGAHLHYAVFNNCKLVSSNFKNAHLFKASFRNADLRGADFQGADLLDADFYGANVLGANFDGVDTHGINNFPLEIPKSPKPQEDAAPKYDISPELHQIRDALMANLVFYTPISLNRRGGRWDEYERDAIKRNQEALELINKIINSNKF